MAINTLYTLTYEPKVKGWPSFYSYNPDWMIGMNQYFYTFKNGNLYKHNDNAARNNFYGVQYSSRIKTVFNDSPLENKLFKTLNIEGNSPWSATLISDVQDSGFVQAGWFEKKEQSWYAFVRNSGTTPAGNDEYVLRSVNGLGNSTTILVTNPSAVVINFPLTLNIKNILSIGDNLYRSTPNPIFVGKVVQVNVNLPKGINQIIVDTTVPNGSLPVQDVDYYMYIKDAIAESHGILGHYGVVELTNTNTSQVELFVVESNVMKSHP